MELGTFGAVLKYALELEERAAIFYESAAPIMPNQGLTDTFWDLSFRCKKRIETLLRVRRENVTEMILEPIHGLEADDYNPSVTIPEDTDSKTILEMAVVLEKSHREFYNKAAIKIDFLIEAAYVFEQLADENSDIVSQLQS